MRVPSERFHTKSTLNSEFPPINEITMLCSHSFQNMIKRHPCLCSSFLQSHPVSVTCLWLSILTLIFRKMSSFVPLASQQDRECHISLQLNRSLRISPLYICSSHFISALPPKEINFLFIYIQKWDQIIGGS